MKLFDTHCHFEICNAQAISEQLARAKASGVEKLMAVGGSDELNRVAFAAAQAARADADLPRVIVAAGYDRDQIGKALAPIEGEGLAAWGEIGLDYHYSPDTRVEQCCHFAAQLEEARARDLPVVIHTREAAEDTIAILKEIPSRGIIHCFTGDPDEAKEYLDLGFFISISGIVTFRAADNVRASARVVPDDRILIETDAPFLAPVPVRGNPNEPAFVKYTCAFLAALRGASAEDFAALTFANAERVLGRGGMLA